MLLAENVAIVPIHCLHTAIAAVPVLTHMLALGLLQLQYIMLVEIDFGEKSEVGESLV